MWQKLSRVLQILPYQLYYKIDISIKSLKRIIWGYSSPWAPVIFVLSVSHFQPLHQWMDLLPRGSTSPVRVSWEGDLGEDHSHTLSSWYSLALLSGVIFFTVTSSGVNIIIITLVLDWNTVWCRYFLTEIFYS